MHSLTSLGRKYSLQKNEQPSDRDFLRLFCQEGTRNIKSSSTKAAMLSNTRVDHCITGEQYAFQFPQHTASCAVPSFWVPGYGFKQGGRSTEKSAAVWEFLVFLVGRGDKSADGGNKSLPAQCERAMFLAGTAAGESIFNDTTKDKVVMKANETGTRTFKFHELLNEDQFKQLLRRPLIEVVNSYKKAAAKEAEASLRAQDPLRAAIFTKTSPALRSRWKKVVANYIDDQELPAELQEQIVVDVLPMPLTQLRQFIYKFVVGSGRQDVDVTIMM